MILWNWDRAAMAMCSGLDQAQKQLVVLLYDAAAVAAVAVAEASLQHHGEGEADRVKTKSLVCLHMMTLMVT